MTAAADPRAAELAREYERRFGPQADYRRRVWAMLTRDVFQRYVPESGAVLEIGCGWGEFINQIRARTKIGIDLNPSAAQRLDHFCVIAIVRREEIWTDEEQDYLRKAKSRIDLALPFCTSGDSPVVPLTNETLTVKKHE